MQLLPFELVANILILCLSLCCPEFVILISWTGLYEFFANSDSHFVYCSLVQFDDFGGRINKATAGPESLRGDMLHKTDTKTTAAEIAITRLTSQRDKVGLLANGTKPT